MYDSIVWRDNAKLLIEGTSENGVFFVPFIPCIPFTSFSGLKPLKLLIQYVFVFKDI